MSTQNTQDNHDGSDQPLVGQMHNDLLSLIQQVERLALPAQPANELPDPDQILNRPIDMARRQFTTTKDILVEQGTKRLDMQKEDSALDCESMETGSGASEDGERVDSPMPDLPKYSPKSSNRCRARRSC
jgi:hypothetical protein